MKVSVSLSRLGWWPSVVGFLSLGGSGMFCPSSLESCGCWDEWLFSPHKVFATDPVPLLGMSCFHPQQCVHLPSHPRRLRVPLPPRLPPTFSCCGSLAPVFDPSQWTRPGPSISSRLSGPGHRVPCQDLSAAASSNCSAWPQAPSPRIHFPRCGQSELSKLQFWSCPCRA